jgi:hypothetical protein
LLLECVIGPTCVEGDGRKVCGAEGNCRKQDSWGKYKGGAKNPPRICVKFNPDYIMFIVLVWFRVKKNLLQARFG